MAPGTSSKSAVQVARQTRVLASRPAHPREPGSWTCGGGEPPLRRMGHSMDIPVRDGDRHLTDLSGSTPEIRCWPNRTRRRRSARPSRNEKRDPGARGRSTESFGQRQCHRQPAANPLKRFAKCSVIVQRNMCLTKQTPWPPIAGSALPWAAVAKNWNCLI